MVTKYRSLFLRLGKQQSKRWLSVEVTVIYSLDKVFKHIHKPVITLKRADGVQ